jgi:hypothetical protein
MTNRCEKCNATFSTKQGLTRHLARQYPCDNRCRECEYKAKNTRQLNRHIKTEHPATEIPAVKAAVARSQEVLEIEPSARVLPKRFPLDDYKWEALVQTVHIPKNNSC